MFNFWIKNKYTEKKINNLYSQYLYTGVLGSLMKYSHRELEKKLPERNFKKILEIGAGSEPHVKYIKCKNFSYYILEKIKQKAIKKIDGGKIYYRFYNGKKIPFKKSTFDRIILSHVLEHVADPENFLVDVMKTLKKGGVLSIALPTDPGLIYRLSRMVNKLISARHKLKVSGLEYDYANAIEHINSIFNLVDIIRHNYKGKIVENFLPFKIKLIDINLFYNVHIIK